MRGYKALCFLLLVGTTPWGGAQASELPFSVVQARTQTLPRERILDGVVEAVNKSTVSAQTAGRVQEVMVDVNDFVEAGSPIVRLRNTEQRAGLDQAEASLREARARFDQAKAEYNRVRKIYDRKLVSKADMDAATASFDAAKARLASAEAGVDQAKEQLVYTVVVAPYSGIVLERHVDMGESVRPGAPLLTGFSLDHLRVVANIPQRLIVPVRKNSRARVLLPEGRGGVQAESLTFFPFADPDSNVFKVRVYLPEKTAGLYPGMFVKTAFGIGETSRLVVPRQAVVYRGEVTGVYVVKEGRVSLRQVRLGRTDADRVEVLAGLEAGETVALDPVAAGVYLKEARAEGEQ
jgi:RND family efflux transporter MFP subunit